jgi:hypothetical protein
VTQQQQHTHKQQVNKKTNNPYGNPTTRYCETFAGRKEGRKEMLAKCTLSG